MRHLTCLLLVIASLGWGGVAEAQAKKLMRAGVLMAGHPSGGPALEELMEGLRRLGWIEGRGIRFELRFAEAKLDRLPSLAVELVRLNVDVIVAGSGAEHAAQQATKSVPIVCVSAGDLVNEGLAESLARPGGNLTGLTRISPQLSGKRLELLKEAVPRVRRVGVFWNRANSASVAELKEAEAAAKSLGLKLQSLPLQAPNDAEKAFGTAAKDRPEALMITRDPSLMRSISRF